MKIKRISKYPNAISKPLGSSRGVPTRPLLDTAVWELHHHGAV